MLVVEDMEISPKRLSTIPFTITDKLLMLMVEVDRGIIPAPLPPIIQVILVYIWVFYSWS